MPYRHVGPFSETDPNLRDDFSSEAPAVIDVQNPIGRRFVCALVLLLIYVYLDSWSLLAYERGDLRLYRRLDDCATAAGCLAMLWIGSSLIRATWGWWL